MTKKDTKKATTAYKRGDSLKAIAAAMGVPTPALRKTLVTEGVEIRLRGRPSTNPKPDQDALIDLTDPPDYD